MPGEIRVLVTDYDRTVTDEDLQPDPACLNALARARRAGLTVIVVSGRTVSELEAFMGHIADGFVGDNGCYALFPEDGGTMTPLFEGAAPRFQELLGHIPSLSPGKGIASVLLEHEEDAREVLRKEGVEVDWIKNRDRVMMLPCGVHKGVGVEHVLERLNVPREQVAAAGDGENDLHLFDAAGYGIAVSNAVPELKKRADYVTEGWGGAGLAEWVRDVWFEEFRPAEG